MIAPATSASPGNGTPPPARFEFDCSCCDRVEFSSVPDLPKGWTLEQCEGEEIALCRDCSDLTARCRDLGVLP